VATKACEKVTSGSGGEREGTVGKKKIIIMIKLS